MLLDRQTQLDILAQQQQIAANTNNTALALGLAGEYSWDSADAKPTPTETAGIVVGLEVNTKKVFVYNFKTSAWVEWMVLS